MKVIERYHEDRPGRLGMVDLQVALFDGLDIPQERRAIGLPDAERVMVVKAAQALAAGWTAAEAFSDAVFFMWDTVQNVGDLPWGGTALLEEAPLRVRLAFDRAVSLLKDGDAPQAPR